MTNLKTFTKALMCASALTAFTAGNAFAVGTAADTTVSNTFTLDYKVDGTAQPQIDSSATPTTFKVDRVVNLTVTAIGTNVNVTAGEQDAELTFRVDNTGNDTQSYDLSAINEGGDEFDASNVTITYYVDNGDGIFQTNGPDGAALTYVDHTGPIPADGSIWVVVTGDIPALDTGSGGVNDADTAEVSLVADTLEPTALASAAGAEVTADAVAGNDMAATENVLADGSGGANEVANAGDHSALLAWVVATADVTAVKTATIINEDGSACSNFATTATAGAYSVPGACIEYNITVTNSGSAEAQEVLAIDILPQELTFVAAQDTGFVDDSGAPAAEQKVLTTGASTNCDGTAATCEIKLDKAELAGGATGVLTIRALLK